MCNVGIIYEGIAHEGEKRDGDGGEKVDPKPGISYHVDEGGTDGCPSFRSTTVALTESLEGWVSA